MLYSIESGKYVKTIPHRRDYDRWRRGLDDKEYQAIYNELRSRISGSEIETSSWIPGSDWSGTVYQPIYEKACALDGEASAKFFGLILWQVVMEHEATWSFGRYKLGNVPIEGLTYFRLTSPT